MKTSTAKMIAVGVLVPLSSSKASSSGSLDLLHSVQQRQREASAGSNAAPRGKGKINLTPTISKLRDIFPEGGCSESLDAFIFFFN